MDMDIRQKVGNFLFEKLNELDQSIASGQVATPEQLDNLFKKYSDAIIREAPILTETGIQQMSNVANAFIGQQKYLASVQQQYAQNAATFTASPAGFYVDGNGMQVTGADGKPVPAPPKPIWSGVQNGKFISV
jgi:glycine/serine hydroxymethyltransferase